MSAFERADTPPAMEADPDTQAEVDNLILDYLVCMAIHQILSRTGQQQVDDEIDWLVDSVQAFRATRHKNQHETLTPNDLDTKLRVFTVTDQLRRYTRAARDSRPRPAALADIGNEFMNLCSAATAKVSESRWFDLGARFMVQAILENENTGDQASSQAISRFLAWTPDKPDQKIQWENSRQKYLSERATVFPVKGLEYLVTDFLKDLMMTLDPPILIQLERGKLDSLSRAETQQLKKRAGIR